MAETAKKISMIPAKVQYDRNVKLSEKKMKVAAYCRVSTELEEQDSSYEAHPKMKTGKMPASMRMTERAEQTPKRGQTLMP